MENEDPYLNFKDECQRIIGEGFKSLGYEVKPEEIRLEDPPDPSLGELSTSICFEFSKKIGENPKKTAEKVAEVFRRGRGLVAEVTSIGGYINFKLDYSKAIPLILENVRSRGDSYGFIRADVKHKVIVEHTSVNPVHPIHIGQARNAILGDALARMLKARGHEVKTHYYIDDMGRQTATLAFGYTLLNGVDSPEKPDHFMGKIYTITSCLVEIEGLRRRLKEAGRPLAREEDVKSKASLDEWKFIAGELKAKYPRIFRDLSKAIAEKSNPESEINDLISRYEGGEPSTKALMRGLSEKCLKGIKETLTRLDITIDSWDWESDLVWDSRVKKVLEKLLKTPYISVAGTTSELEVEEIVEKLDLRGRLGITSAHHLPPLTLARSDGTSLYTTRDIAYSLYKHSLADEVINVIGAEQALPQLQVKIALYALGEEKCARSQVHYAFGLVEMPGYRMSSRRGRLITLDSVIDEAVARARREVSKRSPELGEAEKEGIAERIGKAAIKYSLISLDPLRTVNFTWDRVLNFERNSAPFINYAYTRACGILRKVKYTGIKVRDGVLTHPLEKELILMISKFPMLFMNAADDLKPQDIATYANELAELFHEYYEKVSVAYAEREEMKMERAALVEAVKITLKNSMSILGIEFTRRM